MVRPAYLAGSWYPGDAAGCRRAIESFRVEALAGAFRGLIGPHAGWGYSGRAVVRGYAALAAAAGDVDLAVVFGSHRSATGPNTVFRADAWDTPLGEIPTARALADALAEAGDLADEPEQPHRPDNAVELHLPLVRHFFPHAELLMAGVAAAPVAIDVGRRAGTLARSHGRQAVFIGSTDLTHYGPSYGFTGRGAGEPAVRWVRDENDPGFIERVLALDAAGALAHARAAGSACCPGAVAATLAALAAYGHPASPALVEHYLSYDVHPADSFVGYASIAL